MGFTKQEWREKLGSEREIAKMALAILFQAQTSTERKAGKTLDQNCVGFTKEDAPILTELGRKAWSGKELTVQEMWLALRELPKYACQIHRYMMVWS